MSRIECPTCRASCIQGEANCWQCNALLNPPTRPAAPAHPAPSGSDKPSSRAFRIFKPAKSDKQETDPPDKGPLIQYDPEHLASKRTDPPEEAEETPSLPDVAQPSAGKRVRVTLTGEAVEEDGPEQSAPLNGTGAPGAASIGDASIEVAPQEEVMTLTFCRNCGFENEQGKKECAKCGKQLEVIAVADFKEIEALPRARGFDVLGAIWVILGLAAIYAGQFLLLTDAQKSKASMADYLWTGVVAVAPAVLIFMRHHFCRTLFWVMTIFSIMVWGLIGVVWITGHLHVTDKGQVGLSWLFALSTLSAVSFFLVRTNDAFDYDIGVWLGRQ